MAVDKKSQHYTSAEKYTDLEGHSRQFTFVDHDIKSTLSSTPPMKESELEELRKFISQSRINKIEEILALPAISFVKSKNTFAETFIERNREKGVVWHEVAVRNLISNPPMLDAVHHCTWRYTIKEAYWFEEMSHEDILAGKWKEWA